MWGYTLFDKVLFIIHCILGGAITIFVPTMVYKMGCIDFEIMLYSNIVIISACVFLLVGGITITALYLEYKHAKLNDKYFQLQVDYYQLKEDLRKAERNNTIL